MKKIMLILFIIFTLVSIPVTVFYLGQRQELRKNAAPATSLSLIPSAVNTTAGDTFTLNVQIDTQTNQVVLTELFVQFDATKLEAQSITNGPLFSKIYTSGVVAPGSASISVGVEQQTQPVEGAGVVAVIRFKALAKSETPVQVTFSDQTYVGGLHETSTNVLSVKNVASVNITEKSGAQASLSQGDTMPTKQQTPTPSKTVTLSPTPDAATHSATTSATPTTTTLQSTIQPSPTTSGVPSSVSIELPDSQTLLSNRPTFTGKAPPNTIVTIVIQSDPITETAASDANGVWIYIPTVTLSSGTHTIVASAQNPTTGAVDTATGSFTVGTSAAGLTQEAMPTSGSIYTTIIATGIAITLIGIGLFVFIL